MIKSENTSKQKFSELPNRIGPYAIEAIIGKGGMGVVYKARSKRDGHLAALKTVSIAKESSLQGIRKEIAALARLKHPQIVAILDQGIHESIPWYAMELLEGQSLRQMIQFEESSTQPSPFEKGVRKITSSVADTYALSEITRSNSQSAFTRSKILDLSYSAEIIVKICEPLAFIHERGLVHQDLKPDNIFISPDHTPILLDFGIMREIRDRRHHETLRIERSVIGTLPYMAPEQFKGMLIDARADIYAIGCIFYELVTGQQPFSGKSFSELQTAHLFREPVPPKKLNDSISASMSELILGMLQKERRQRIGYADLVASRLLPFLPESRARSIAVQPRIYLYSSSLHGREKQMHYMKGLTERAITGKGSFCLIQGESGSGKTRFMKEVGQIVSHRGFIVITGAVEEKQRAPLGIFRHLLQIIVDRCISLGAEETKRLFGKDCRLLSQYEYSIREVPGYEEFDDPEDLGLLEAQLRLFSALMKPLTVLVQEQPVLILLDDIHWADELSLAFLNYLSKSDTLQDIPLLICCSFRAEEMPAIIEEFLGMHSIHHLTLPLLDENNVSVAVMEMLALDEAPGDFVTGLQRVSSGNPFFLAEYMHLLVEEGFLRRDGAGRWLPGENDFFQTIEQFKTKGDLPETLAQLLTRRLSHLEPEEREIAKFIALFEREVSMEDIFTLSPYEEDLFNRVILRLRTKHILKPADEPMLSFIHAGMNRILSAEISEKEKKVLHRVIAELLIKHFEKGDIQISAEIAEHFEESGDAQKAAEYYLIAGRHFRTVFAMADAKRCYEKYFSFASHDDQYLGNRLAFADDILHHIGKTKEAIESLDAILPLVHEKNLQRLELNVINSLGRMYSRIGQPERAIELYRQSLELARATNSRYDICLVTGNIATVLYETGKLDEAMSYNIQALEQAREYAFRKREGNILSNIAIIHHDRGDLDRAEELYKECLSIAQETNEKKLECTSLSNLAIFYLEQGKNEDSEKFFHQTLNLSREIGYRRLEGNSLGGFAYFLIQEGRLEEAQTKLQETLIIHREVNNILFEGIALRNLAEVELMLGNFDTALLYFQQALEKARYVGDKRFEAIVIYSSVKEKRRLGKSLEPLTAELHYAKELLEKLHDPFYLSNCIIEQGHCKLASARSANDELQRAREILGKLNLKSESIPMVSLSNLEKAQALFEESGVTNLFHGELPEKVPQIMKK